MQWKKKQGTITAEKEDATDSTANKTIATFTSSCESEWDEYTVDGMMEPSTLSNHAYGFGGRRWVKPSRKWRTPTPQVCNDEQTSSKLNTAGHVQAQIIKGIFMFRSAAQEATMAKSSLSALQDLPSHQEVPKVQVNATKKPGRWSMFGKFKTGTKKTQETNVAGGTTRRQRKHRPKPRTIYPFEMRNQELKIEENKGAQRKPLN